MSDNAPTGTTWTDRILRVVEPPIFKYRRTTLAILIAITAILAVQAARIHPDAGWLKSIPLDHPYMQTFQKYYSDFGGANTVLFALIQEDGDIYNETFRRKLEEAPKTSSSFPGLIVRG